MAWKLSYSMGNVTGLYHDELMVCQYPHMSNAQGSLWFGNNPLSHTVPLLFLQFILLFGISRLLYLFLKPLRQNIMSAQILAGIIMGPSILARNINYAVKVLPLGGKTILSTAADVGLVMHLFIIGVQIDTTVLIKAGRSSAIIGLSGFIFAFIFGGSAMFILTRNVMIDRELHVSLLSIVSSGPITSFPVVTSLCADLNILNSELGKLASFSSMICDLSNIATIMVIGPVFKAITTNDITHLWPTIGIIVYVICVVSIFRPWIIRIGKNIPERKPIREYQFIVIMSIVLVCAFTSDYLGIHSGVGTFLLGLAIPDGPPLGDNLVYKLEAMSSGIFLPAKYGITGLNADLFSIKKHKFALVVELIIISGYMGKFLGVLVSALICNWPLKEAVSIGLAMCCRGVIDVALFCLWKDAEYIGELEYTLLIVTMLIVTGLARPLIGYLYDPSKRYKVHVRSSLLQYHHRNAQPRILIVIHTEENVPTMINLLEASNPTKSTRLSIIVLYLKELKGRATSMLVPNFTKGKLSSALNHSEHIVNAFACYENDQSQGNVLIQHFTAISPYASMHDDVCNLALDKRVTIVILPFHKQWDIDGTVGAIFPSIRMINRNILKKAPCTVGVLVDRRQMNGGNWTLLTEHSIFSVALLFLGGMDDREAFAYASRMVEHPHVTLYVVWIRQTRKGKEDVQMDETIDVELMEDFKTRTKGNNQVVFKKETIEDAVGTTSVIHSIEDIGFDLFIVGRYHDPNDPRIMGLTNWSECPELGVIGDMLSTSDFTFSVLVIQQQPMGDAFAESSYHTTRVHPDHTLEEYQLGYVI